MERELQVVLIEDDPIACKEFKEYIDTVSDVMLVEITNNAYRAIDFVKKFSSRCSNFRFGIA